MKKCLLFFAVILHSVCAFCQWQFVYNINGGYGVANCFAASGNNIYAGCNFSGGVLLSTDSGLTWITANDGLNNTAVNAMAASGLNLFASTSGPLYNSVDGGNYWNTDTAGMDQSLLLSLAVTISGNYVFAATGNSGLYRNTILGSIWAPVETGIPGNWNVATLASNGGRVYAGMNGAGIYVTNNNGESWGQTGLTTGTIDQIAFNGNYVYAATFDEGVQVSADTGATWTTANKGISNLAITSIAVSGGYIVIGTEGEGVFISVNNGATWTPYNNDLPNMDITAIAIFGNTLFCGTDSGSIWINQNLSNINEINSNNNLMIFPNPADDRITLLIKEGVPLYSEKSYALIYDMAGRLIIQQPVFQFNTQIDVNNLVMGEYCIKLEDETERTFAYSRFIKQ